MNVYSKNHCKNFSYKSNKNNKYHLFQKTTEILENLTKALVIRKTQNNYISRTLELHINENTLTKLTNALLLDQSQVQRFSLKIDSMTEITCQGFEMFFQAVTAFEVDIKNNNSIVGQSIQEVISSINRIRQNVRRMNVQIENLGRVKDDILSKVKGEKTESIKKKGETAKVQKRYSYKSSRKAEAITVLDTKFQY